MAIRGFPRGWYRQREHSDYAKCRRLLFVTELGTNRSAHPCLPHPPCRAFLTRPRLPHPPGAFLPAPEWFSTSRLSSSPFPTLFLTLPNPLTIPRGPEGFFSKLKPRRGAVGGRLDTDGVCSLPQPPTENYSTLPNPLTVPRGPEGVFF